MGMLIKKTDSPVDKVFSILITKQARVVTLTPFYGEGGGFILQTPLENIVTFEQDFRI